MVKLRFALIAVLLLALAQKSMAQETAGKKVAKIDSSYKNWYYNSREDFYTLLEHIQYDVVFFGNSITERGDWQELIGSRLAVANRGIGGDNSFGLKARLPGIVKLKPKKVFIMIGTNDIGRGLPVDVILTNYRAIIETMKVQLPKTKIYIQSALPLNDELLNYDYLKNKSQQIVQLNKGLQSLANETQTVYVDLEPIFSSEKNVLNPKHTSDGIHLKAEAYLLWVKHLKDKKYL